MNDTWAKAQLEQMSNALARILSDVEKFEGELADFRQLVGVRESRPADTLKRFERSYGAAVAKNLAKDIEAAIMHPGESVQTWHEDKGPEWPEEEE